MAKVYRKIQIPDALISNQFTGDNISPKTTYLYMWFKILLRDYKTNTFMILPKKLREVLGWKTNVMLKAHMKILKENDYITYQDEFDTGKLKANVELIITIRRIKGSFKEITDVSLEKIISKTSEPEKAIRLCYIIKCYTNKNYGYCWLTYNQIYEWGSIRPNDISTLIESLHKEKLLHISKGGTFVDKDSYTRKENNKYQLLLN